MSKIFAERAGVSLSRVNSEVLEEWEREDLFRRSVTEREGCPAFIFFEGPPSANGHPGIHHVLARTIKDTFCRYKTMRGFQVRRKAGWDTHGLPVELGVEKELGITKEDIGKTISIEDYNRKCRRNVMKYTGEWTDLSRRMGYWVDMEHPYVTCDNKYIETLWWLLKRLYGKGLLYKGYTIQPYSPAAGTGLSSHELNQPGCYRDVRETTVTAQFRLTTPLPLGGAEGAEALPQYVLAWTTTPWTLPSNTALCVGPAIDYVAVEGENPLSRERAVYILAESRLAAYFGGEGKDTPRPLWRGKGAELAGLRYRQLMPWVKPCDTADGRVRVREADAFRLITGDYVTTDDGTGVVHIAPTFGADDARVAREAGVPSLFVVDKAGDTRPMVDFTGKYFLPSDMDPEFRALCLDERAYAAHQGAYVKNAYDPRYSPGGKYDEKAAQRDKDLNVVLCMEMREQGTAFRIEKHTHNYPHCWRTDKPILYYPLDSWFIRASAARARMMELNRGITWKPESTGTGRFGKWLEGLNDWNLSRSRYWGTPLPIWRNKDTREEKCVGSLEELSREIDKAVAAGVMSGNPLTAAGFRPGDMSAENYGRIDLHRPFVDTITLVGESGAPLTREADLIDVWFDSGAMPYAQLHYPFEHRDELDSGRCFPADFIAEGVDQTRGWFYTLHAIATMVSDRAAYKAVISNGLVLDKNGMKMSKRLGNAVDPFGCIERHGSDAVRWYMVTNCAPWDNLKFDEEGVREVTRSFFGKLFQTYSFLAMYANVDCWDGSQPDVPAGRRPEMDRWLMSRLNTLAREAGKAYEDYEPTRAGRLIQSFVTDEVSNWYVRLSKRRFWGSAMSEDKVSAYQTLYTCLQTVARLMAPIAPFYADRLWRDLRRAAGKPAESVHLAPFPQPDEAWVDTEREARMELAQKVTSMILSLRKKEQIVVKQPLRRAAIPDVDPALRRRIESMRQLILDEVNVKELEFVSAGGVLVKRVKCDFRAMGKKFGKLMKNVSQAVQAMGQDDIARLEAEGFATLRLAGGDTARVELADVEIYSQDIPGWSVANEGTLTVALDLRVDEELRLEGAAREMVRAIQTLRKESGLEITDRIRAVVPATPQSEACLARFGGYIASQVLADSVTAGQTDSITLTKI